MLVKYWYRRLFRTMLIGIGSAAVGFYNEGEWLGSIHEMTQASGIL